jgi:hypothetical protein
VGSAVSRRDQKPRAATLCKYNRARARALREDCLTVFPRAVTPFLPALDGAARRWLTRSCSPYVPEIAQIAATLGESCPAYATAKSVLENTPVARPVIFTLIGCAPGERCVIERTENGFCHA